MNAKTARLRALFDEAIQLPPERRAELLDARCANDQALRCQVEALIATAEGDGPFLNELTRTMTLLNAARSAAAGSTATPPLDAPPPQNHGSSTADATADSKVVLLPERPGARIGPYKLLQLIGEGGFGSVFMAEQNQPVRRRVALKIIKLGMDTRQVVARFEAERQALALMDHPHIARVLDAGTTKAGRPYFVMELVKGEPLTAYCDRENLTIQERLDVFLQVCHAVQHAHTKGVIHRDIKPNNVLVSTQDGKPHAKVIDFGIAKATDHRLTEKTLFTEMHQLVGTPQYMSPEQAEGSLDIDTRTDVYSLGVLLYELLTGVTPFDPARLRAAAYGEIQRIIREVEAPRPSTRLEQTTRRRVEGAAPDDSLAAVVSAHRRTDPRALTRLLRGELDWIVMRCLEKDRARRYEAASGLASDIHRYLHGEPVVAAPPSAAYRFRKFARRHALLVGASAAVATALLVGAVGATTGMVWALRERESANKARDAAVAAQAETLAAKDRITAQAERERQVSQFLQELFLVSDPGSGRPATTDMKSILVRCRELFGEDHTVTDSVLASWIRLLITTGQVEQAEPAAAEFYRQTTRRMDNDPFTAVAVQIYAQVLSELKRCDEAVTLLREFLATQDLGIPIPNRNRLATLQSLVETLPLTDTESAKQEQLVLWPRLLEEASAVHGAADDRVLKLRCAYGTWLQESGLLTEAIDVLAPAVIEARRRDQLQRSHVLSALNSLTVAYALSGEAGLAKPLWRELLDLLRAQVEVSNPLYKASYDRYVAWLRVIGDVESARAEESRFHLDLAREQQGRSDAVCYHLAIEALEDKRGQEALDVLTPLYQKLGAELEPMHAHRLIVDRLYATCLLDAGSFEEAEQEIAAYVDRVERGLGENHSAAIRGRLMLADAFERRGAIEEARSAYTEAWRRAESLGRDDAAVVSRARRALARFCEAHGPERERDRWRAEVKSHSNLSLPGPANLDFEAGDIHDSADGWLPAGTGYRIADMQWLSAEGAYKGTKCMVLSTLNGATLVSGAAGCRNLMQTFEAAAYRNKRICFSAAVGIENTTDEPNAQAQLWLRVDRPLNASPYLFDNMHDRPIGSPEWAHYEITGLVDADAESINIGIMVFGGATARLDDVKFEILPDDSLEPGGLPKSQR